MLGEKRCACILTHILLTMQTMSIYSNGHLASLVRSSRTVTGLNQGDFAKLLGKSQAVVCRYEKGKVEPPGEIVMHCMQLLGASPVQLKPPSGSWDETLNALEAAIAIVKSLRDASADLTQRDTPIDSPKRPRLA